MYGTVIDGPNVRVRFVVPHAPNQVGDACQLISSFFFIHLLLGSVITIVNGADFTVAN
jgi:hypothetical protein